MCLFRSFQDTRFIHNGDICRIFNMECMSFVVARNIDFELRKMPEPAGRIVNHMATRDLVKDTLIAFRHSNSYGAARASNSMRSLFIIEAADNKNLDRPADEYYGEGLKWNQRVRFKHIIYNG